MNRRRYEILLPARYNDGRVVMDDCMECFAATKEEVLDRFGAFSYNPHSLMGVWTQDGQRYHDELFKLTIDVDDTPASVGFIKQLKAELLMRFDQLEIYVVAYPIAVL
ncbi:MAG TPA: hypothetical protein PKE45_19395 [Caldilineaceae bacterium]|nr:hypothetical protein [Caldilineaceae bacterium]